MSEVLFGYRHVTGIPPCPCNDPGTYMSCEVPDKEKPLAVVFHCWCGSKMKAEFDDEAEKAEFLKTNGVTT